MKRQKVQKDFCENCPIKSRTVGNRGYVKSPLVIVGESPGSKEVREGVPFIGPSGQFLDEMLNKVGIKVEPYYTNAFKCLPPRSDKDKKDQLLNDACRACHDRLISEIEEHPRKLIVAMGNAALRSLTGRYNASITRERGALLSHESASVGLLPCFHPAHVLRNEGLFPQAFADLKKIPRLLKGDIPSDPKFKTKIIKTDNQIKKLAKKINKKKIVVADIETTGLSRYDDEFMNIGLTTFPLPDYKSGKKIPVYIIEELEILKSLLALLGNKIKWCWHNGKFDVGFLWAKGLDRKKIHTDHDTMLLSYVLDENGGRHGLERCIMDWLGVTGYKDMLEDYLKVGAEIHNEAERIRRKQPVKNRTDINKLKEHLVSKHIDGIHITAEMAAQYIRTGMGKKAFALIPKERLNRYLSKDIVYTGWLLGKLYKLVKKDKVLRGLYENLLIPASDTLTQMELNGVPISQEAVRQSARELEDKIKPIVRDLKRITKDPKFNPNSHPQVMRVIKERNIKVKDSNKDTLLKFQTDKEKGIKGDEFIDKLLEYRKQQKLYGTYIRPYLMGTKSALPGLDRGRVNTTFLIHGTVTGRLSSNGPNVQNLPKAKVIRRIVKVKKGRIIVSLDYSQAELRSLGVLSGDENLLNVFRSGQDLHTAVAHKMFEDQISQLNMSDPDDKFEFAVLRRKAKTINFGVVYGVTPPTLAERLNISLDEAEDLVKNWFATFPVAEEFMNETRDVRTQALTTVFGRKRRFHIITDSNQHNLANEAGNFLHQSMCSDFALESAIRLNRTVPEMGLQGNPFQFNIVHDDNIFEIDKKKQPVIELIKVMRDVMEAVPVDMGIDAIPFTAEASMGESWASLRDVRMDLIDENRLAYKPDD